MKHRHNDLTDDLRNPLSRTGEDWAAKVNALAEAFRELGRVLSRDVSIIVRGVSRSDSVRWYHRAIRRLSYRLGLAQRPVEQPRWLIHSGRRRSRREMRDIRRSMDR